MTSFFGQYLLVKGIVSRTQLDAAIELQDQTNQTLAQIALFAGVLSQQQLQKLPLSGCENDTLFTQAVVSLGWISRTVIETLHAQQRTVQLTLGEALVQHGYLRDNNLPNLLADYHYWNLRNLQKFSAAVAASDFAKLVDIFSYTLTQYMLEVYGVHVRPNFANSAPVPSATSWVWQMDLPDTHLNIMVPDSGAGMALLAQRAELIDSLHLPALLPEQPSGLTEAPSAMAPERFFASLLQGLLTDIEAEGLHQMAAQVLHSNNSPATAKSCLRCCYSVEGELFNVYFCTA